MGHKKGRKRKAAARLRERLIECLADFITAVLSGLITAAILKVLKW